MWHSSPKQIITEDEMKVNLLKFFWSKVKETDPEKCWFYNGNRRNYYPRIDIMGRSCTMHRVVFELFFRFPPKDKPYILHSCDEKSCINPNHLRCGTTRSNHIDRRFNGKELVVSERDVKVIKFMRSLDYTFKEISEKFNCSISKARDICLGINTPGVLPNWYTPITREAVIKSVIIT